MSNRNGDTGQAGVSVSPSPSKRQIAFRAAIVWIGLMVAESIHGVLRAVVLVPRIGEFRSNQIGVFTGSIIILVIAFLTQRWIGGKRPSEWLLVGSIWLVLTVAFEWILGRYVMGLSWERMAASYDLTAGGLMPLGLAVLLLSPVAAAKRRAGS